MASTSSLVHTLPLALLFATFLLYPHSTLSQNPPESSPSPSPQLPAADISPPPATPSSAPSPAPFLSPPAPPPSDLYSDSPSPAPSPDADAPAPAESKKTPSPATLEAGVINHEDPSAGDLESKDDKPSGGMSGGQKAGVAFGVIAGACIVGVGTFVYKKRQQNIRRQYGYAARREML